MAIKLQIRGDLAAEWTLLNPILAEREMAFEIDTRRAKLGDGTTPWNSLPYAAGGEAYPDLAGDTTIERNNHAFNIQDSINNGAKLELNSAYAFLCFTDGVTSHFINCTAANGINLFSLKGMVVPRLTTTERNAIASPWEGTLIFNTTLNKFQGWENGNWITFILPVVNVAPIGGVLTLDCQNEPNIKFICDSQAIASATTISIINSGKLIHLHLAFPVIGTVPLTWPSTTRMARAKEASSGDGWNQATKVLTVTSQTPGDWFEFSLIKISNIYKLNSDGPTRA